MSSPAPLRTHMRAILALGLPLIGSHLAQMAINVTDTVMLGWYSVEALAGVVLGSTMFFVIFIVGAGFAWAVMPLVAAAAEEGDDVRIRRITRMGLWISLGLAGLAMPLMWFSQPLLVAAGQEPEVAARAQAYLRIAGWGMAPALAVMVLKSYLAALERTRVVLWATLAAAAVNALADYALIFGHWGAPELGLRGAALASVATQAASLVILAVYAVRTLPQHGLFHRLWRPDWAALAEVARMGLQIGLTSLAESGLFAASTVIMGWIGTLQLAAHGIAIQVVSVFFMIQVGLANAATVRAGRALGRGDIANLRQGARAVIALSMLVAATVSALLALAPELFIGLFLDPADPLRADILRIGRSLLLVAALFQLFDAAQVIALGLLRGIQDTRVPMLMAGFAYWVVGVPASYVLGIKAGLGGPGVWLGLVLGLALAAALMMARFWRETSRLAPRAPAPRS